MEGLLATSLLPFGKVVGTLFTLLYPFAAVDVSIIKRCETARESSEKRIAIEPEHLSFRIALFLAQDYTRLDWD